MKNKALREEINKSLKETIAFYLNEINLYNYLGKSAYGAHELPNTQVNTFYPVFFMLKKCLNLYKKLLSKMELHENVYNCKYKEELFKSEYYLNLIQELKGNYEII